MAIGTQQTSQTYTSQDNGQSYRGPLMMVTTLFFMWGFLTCLNDILIPHLKAIFDLSYAAVMLVQFSFFGAYAVFSIPAGFVTERVGYKPMMVAGLLTMACGALLFIPAATVPSFPLFLAALIILAAGITVLQVAANPYVALLGPAKTASSRLTLTQAFNSFGTFIAPYIGGVLILATAPKTAAEIARLLPAQLQAYRIEQASSVKLPYVIIAAALTLLAIVIGRFKLPHIPEAEGGHAVEHDHDSIWQHPNLVMGALAIFAYVGAEVAIGSFLVNYLHEPIIGNLDLETAAKYLMFYWGGAMVGRFIGSYVLQQLPPRAVLATNAFIAAALICTSMATTGHVAMVSILAIGFFNSIMFPTIFTLGIEGLGPLTGEASGMLNTAIVGGAIIPLLQGVIADRIGIHHAFFLPAICYLYIVLFAIKGTPRQRAVAPA
ncbi:MAG TPA: sugar MFS transporter [Candidatus Bathyarchaeia archaeon]|nr:sugar MFS transporter [Candidatus Bathyarchaeia archaeon]